MVPWQVWFSVCSQWRSSDVWRRGKWLLHCPHGWHLQGGCDGINRGAYLGAPFAYGLFHLIYFILFYLISSKERTWVYLSSDTCLSRMPYSRGNTPLGTGPQVEIDAFSAFGTSHWGGSYWARGYAWAQGRHRVKVRVKTRRTLERWARSGWSRSIIYIYRSLIECTNSIITASPVFSCGNSWGSWNNSGGTTEIRNRAALRMSRWGPTSKSFGSAPGWYVEGLSMIPKQYWGNLRQNHIVSYWLLDVSWYIERLFNKLLDLNCFVQLLDLQCGDRLFTMAIKQLCSQCSESLKME